jgi:hypothetical protein
LDWREMAKHSPAFICAPALQRARFAHPRRNKMIFP